MLRINHCKVCAKILIFFVVIFRKLAADLLIFCNLVGKSLEQAAVMIVKV
jgi:hypothetical protein